jgi:hypothetical protein
MIPLNSDHLEVFDVGTVPVAEWATIQIYNLEELLAP